MSTIIISDKATVYAANGELETSGATVCDHGDTISINATEHNKSDLIEISADRIVSIFGWEVTL